MFWCSLQFALIIMMRRCAKENHERQRMFNQVMAVYNPLSFVMQTELFRIKSFDLFCFSLKITYFCSGVCLYVRIILVHQGEKVLTEKTNLRSCLLYILRQFISGLTGFDGEMKWYVSTRSLDYSLLNQSSQKINWRKQLRSRCLIEAQQITGFIALQGDATRHRSKDVVPNLRVQRCR